MGACECRCPGITLTSSSREIDKKLTPTGQVERQMDRASFSICPDVMHFNDILLQKENNETVLAGRCDFPCDCRVDGMVSVWFPLSCLHFKKLKREIPCTLSFVEERIFLRF